jgi:hypothetical protein
MAGSRDLTIPIQVLLVKVVIMKTTNLFKVIGIVGFISIANSQIVIANDPCYGYDVACDSSGCLVCWDIDENSIACEDDISQSELDLTLPGCTGASHSTQLNNRVKIRRAGNFRLHHIKHRKRP